MSKLKLFRDLLGPLADILAILTFFGLNIFTIWHNLLSKPPWFLLLLAVSGIFILRIFINLLRRINDIYKTASIQTDLEKGITIVNPRDIGKILPTTNTLIFLLEKIKKRAKDWDNQADFLSLNLYLEYNNKWNIPSLQAYYYSNWKDETAIFYEGRNNSEDLQAGKSLSMKLGSLPFFLINKRWKKEVEKSFNNISSRIGNYCKVKIQDGSFSNYYIDIEYYEGKVRKSKKFELGNGFHLLGK